MTLVESSFITQLPAGRSGRKNFHNQVRRTSAPFFIDFGTITDDNQVGLHHGRDLIV